MDFLLLFKYFLDCYCSFIAKLGEMTIESFWVWILGSIKSTASLLPSLIVLVFQSLNYMKNLSHRSGLSSMVKNMVKVVVACFFFKEKTTVLFIFHTCLDVNEIQIYDLYSINFINNQHITYVSVCSVVYEWQLGILCS